MNSESLRPEGQQLFDAVGGHADYIFFGDPTADGKRTIVKETTGWEVMWYLAFFITQKLTTDIGGSRGAGECSLVSSVTGAEAFLEAVRPLLPFAPTAVSFSPPSLSSKEIRESIVAEGLSEIFKDHADSSFISFEESMLDTILNPLFLTLWNGMPRLRGFDGAYDKSIWRLRLVDATSDFREPCVMDVKMGFCGYSPFTAEDKKQRIQSRTSALIRKTGIRICGTNRYLAHPSDSETGKQGDSKFKEKLRKPFFYALKTEEELLMCLQHFFYPSKELGEHKDGVTYLNQVEGSNEELTLPRRRVADVRAAVQSLLHIFEQTAQGTYLISKLTFVSSSLLFIYESDASLSRVLLIDFARCGERRLNYKEEKNGFLCGLATLFAYLNCMEENYYNPNISALIRNGSASE